jgi:hypothetical protein
MKIFNQRNFKISFSKSMNQNTFFLVLFSLLGLISCTTFLELDDDFGDDLLVVNSLFDSENRWRVLVDYSRDISNISNRFNPAVADTIVTIYDDENRVIERLTYGQDENLRYYFLGNTTPEVGKSYFIEVINGDNIVRSQLEKIPATVPIKSFILDSANIDQESKEISAQLTFVDPANESNYYFLEFVYLGYRIFREDTLSASGSGGLRITNSGVANGFSGENSSLFRNNFFTDNLFDGREFTLELEIPSIGNDIFINELEIRMHSISASYYEYLNTRFIQNRTRNDPFAQPTQVFSNITGGLGIFAGYSTSSVSLLD